MAETGRHTNTVSGKRRPQNVYVDGNTVRKVQEVPERREYRQPEHSVRKNKGTEQMSSGHLLCADRSGSGDKENHITQNKTDMVN